MKNFFGWVVLAVVIVTGAARAQGVEDEMVFVQIKALPSLSVAQAEAREYAAELSDVNGFSLGGSWYGIALGPYRRADAEQVLRVYRGERKIPADSFLSTAENYGTQFWPFGANVLAQGITGDPGISSTIPTLTPATTEQVADETPAEARRNERQLSAEERRALQRALEWAGFYNSGIDGAFGPGTRRAMADWQLANGHEPTGVMTTRQRAQLLEQFNAPLTSAGMAGVRDIRAGIAMDLPMGKVAFERYAAPFAMFEPTDDMGVRVLLISQPGDRDALFGLYEIMQTLEIVPLEGPRERGRDRFTLEGRNGRIISYTEARLVNGEIKGFTLIWPVGDEERRTRVLAAMQASFERLSGTLDPTTGADAEQDVDLISGLEIRRPRLSRSGFYVDRTGTVVTTSAAVQSCTRITLDEAYAATVVAEDAALGVAVLRPEERLAPVAFASFSETEPRLKSDIAVSGYSFEGLLGAPTLTYGAFEDAKGLRGETELRRLTLTAEPGDAGGPVFDAGGHVMGMLLPASEGAQKLPADVRFAASAQAIRNVLDVAGASVVTETGAGSEAAGPLSDRAMGMTVLVSCWD